MNASDIDSTPAGPEMDAMVAEKVFGGLLDETRRLVIHGETTGRLRGAVIRGKKIEVAEVPPYSTSDSAALEVVKKVSGWPGRSVLIALVQPGQACVRVLRLFSGDVFSDGEELVTTVDETLALAICRAALKATLP